MYFQNKKYTLIKLASFFLLLIFFSVFINNRYSVYTELRSQENKWFRKEVTGLLVNYQFHYLKPPNSIDEFINFLNDINSENPSKLISHVIASLDQHKNNLCFSTKNDSNNLVLFYKSFCFFNGINHSKIVNIDTVSFLKTCLNKYNILLTYYEIPNLCTDNLYRVFVNDTIIFNGHLGYDMLINNEIRPIAKKLLTDLKKDEFFEAVIIINIKNRSIRVSICEGSLSRTEMKNFIDYLQKQIFNLNMVNAPDSIFIPIINGQRPISSTPNLSIE